MPSPTEMFGGELDFFREILNQRAAARMEKARAAAAVDIPMGMRSRDPRATHVIPLDPRQRPYSYNDIPLGPVVNAGPRNVMTERDLYSRGDEAAAAIAAQLERDRASKRRGYMDMASGAGIF